LVKELSAKGAEVIEVAAYQSQCPVAIAPAALDALQRRVDVITLPVPNGAMFLSTLRGSLSYFRWGLYCLNRSPNL